MWYFRIEPYYEVGVKGHTWFYLDVNRVYRGQKNLGYLLVEGLR